MNKNCYKCENYDCDENGAHCMLLDSSKCSFLKTDRATDTTVEVGAWVQYDDCGGYYDKDGNFILCEEYGTDADFDRYAVDVQNGNGYYNSDGKYVSYGYSNDAWWNQEY